MNRIVRCLLSGFVLLVVPGFAEPAQAAFPFELVPSVPTDSDSVILRLRPGTGPAGTQLHFIIDGDSPTIEVRDSRVFVRARVCTFPTTVTPPLSRDVVIGRLPAGNYSTTIEATYTCQAILPPYLVVWQGNFAVRGTEPISVPALGPGTLVLAGFLLMLAAASGLKRRLSPTYGAVPGASRRKPYGRG